MSPAWFHARPLEGFLLGAGSRKAAQRIVLGMWSSWGLSCLAVQRHPAREGNTPAMKGRFHG